MKKKTGERKKDDDKTHTFVHQQCCSNEAHIYRLLHIRKESLEYVKWLKSGTMKLFLLVVNIVTYTWMNQPCIVFHVFL